MIGDNYQPPTIADIRTAVDHILAMPRVRKHHPHDNYEPTPADHSDPDFEGADMAEARETNWRNGA